MIGFKDPLTSDSCCWNCVYRPLSGVLKLYGQGTIKDFVFQLIVLTVFLYLIECGADILLAMLRLVAQVYSSLVECFFKP
ncbi:MAG: hypothetical protein MHMPM18_001802 [Marteilia pararefringens]